MVKYSKKLTGKITALVEKDMHSVSDICSMLGIARKTFYEWKNTKPEFGQALAEAEKRRDERMSQLSRISIRERLEGYTATEEKETYVPDRNDPSQLMLKSKVVKRKQYPPEVKAARTIMLRDELKQAASRMEVQNDFSDIGLVIEHNSEESKRKFEMLRDNLLAGKIR